MKDLIYPLTKSYLRVALYALFLQGFTVLFINVALIEALPYLYNGLIYIFAATGILLVVLIWRKTANEMNLLILSFACVINLSYFALIPTIVDRSISVFALNELTGGPRSISELESAFVRDFVYEGGAIQKRVDEQVLSGNVSRREDGRFELTRSGINSVSLFRFLAKVYDTDQVSIDDR